MNTLKASELKTMIDNEEDFTLINVLPREEFEKQHIPNSQNVPHDRDTFVSDVKTLVGSKDAKVVVYCANRECQASPKAADKLVTAGFTNVYDFEDGMAGWRLAGYEITEPATSGSNA